MLGFSVNLFFILFIVFLLLFFYVILIIITPHHLFNMCSPLKSFLYIEYKNAVICLFESLI